MLLWGGIACLALCYARNLPLSYHVQQIMVILHYHFQKQRNKGGKAADALEFEACTHFRVYPGDLDWNMHCNNSVYNLVLDNARMRWFVFSEFYQSCKKHGCWIANGGVNIRFHRELKLGMAYRVVVRIAAYDTKWILLEHRFLVGDVLHAQAFARLVVKEGRKTVAPEDLFTRLGYASSQIAKRLINDVDAHLFEPKSPPNAKL